MNELEFNAQDLMDWERLQSKFAKGIPSIEEINGLLHALSVVDKLNDELNKLDENSDIYQKQLQELLEIKRSTGKKNNKTTNIETEEPQEQKKKKPYLKVLVCFFLCVIVMLIILFLSTGLKFVEQVHAIGSVMIGIGVVIAVVAFIFELKGRRIRKKRELHLNKNIVKMQLKWDSTQEDINHIKESTQKVKNMVCVFLEKYSVGVEEEEFVEKLLELRKDIEMYQKLEKKKMNSRYK